MLIIKQNTNIPFHYYYNKTTNKKKDIKFLLI